MNFERIARLRFEIETEVQKDLETLGLEVTTSNIKELEDAPGLTYFHDLSQKALSEAHADARIAQAESQREGDVGEKVREMESRQAVAQSEMTATLTENERDMKIAEST